MTVSGVSASIAPVLLNIQKMNTQLDDLQRQLGTGQKADNYSALARKAALRLHWARNYPPSVVLTTR